MKIISGLAALAVLGISSAAFSQNAQMPGGATNPPPGTTGNNTGSSVLPEVDDQHGPPGRPGLDGRFRRTGGGSVEVQGSGLRQREGPVAYNRWDLDGPSRQERRRSRSRHGSERQDQHAVMRRVRAVTSVAVLPTACQTYSFLPAAPVILSAAKDLSRIPVELSEEAKGPSRRSGRQAGVQRAAPGALTPPTLIPRLPAP